MAELGACAAGALLGPAIVLLERVTLSNGIVCPLMDQIQISWLLGGQGTGPALSRDTLELAHLIPGGTVSRQQKLAPPEDLLISPSLCLLTGAVPRSSESSR